MGFNEDPFITLIRLANGSSQGKKAAAESPTCQSYVENQHEEPQEYLKYVLPMYGLWKFTFKPNVSFCSSSVSH